MGASIEKPSTLQYQKFYGRELPSLLPDSNVLTGWFNEAVASLDEELKTFLAPVILSLLSKLDNITQWTSESLHAEKLRQLFGEPQSVLAIPVAIALTETAERAFLETYRQATSAEAILQNLQAQFKKLVAFYLADRIAKAQAKLAEAEKAEKNLESNYFLNGKQSQVDKKIGLRLIMKRIEKLQRSIKAQEEKLQAWWQRSFSPVVEKTEGVIFQAQVRVAKLPPLNPSLAIPN